MVTINSNYIASFASNAAKQTSLDLEKLLDEVIDLLFSSKGGFLRNEIVESITNQIDSLGLRFLKNFNKEPSLHIVFKNVEELKYKECDRLRAIIHNLEAFGIKAYEKNNDLFVEGGKVKRMPKITTFDDHRIAMAFTILSLTSFEKYELDNIQCVDISLPNFFNYLSEVTK